MTEHWRPAGPPGPWCKYPGRQCRRSCAHTEHCRECEQDRRKATKPKTLTARQVQFLQLLDRHPGWLQQDFGPELYCTKANVSQLVRKCIQQGAVIRMGGHRSLVITEFGRAQLRRFAGRDLRKPEKSAEKRAARMVSVSIG